HRARARDRGAAHKDARACRTALPGRRPRGPGPGPRRDPRRDPGQRRGPPTGGSRPRPAPGQVRRPPRRLARHRPRLGDPGQVGNQRGLTDMAFSGWGDEALEFYEGLEADNSKTYWT